MMSTAQERWRRVPPWAVDAGLVVLAALGCAGPLPHGRPFGDRRSRQRSAGSTAEARKGDPLAGCGWLTRPGWGMKPSHPTGPHRMYLAGLVAALSRYSRGPRRKKRDQIAANTIAPRMYVSTGTQDFVVPAPEAGHADCARKWPT